MNAHPVIAEFDLQADSMLGGATAVEASAGTGKTWTIERIVLARVLAGVEMQRIALMSFTRAAADELAERGRIRSDSPARRGQGARAAWTMAPSPSSCYRPRARTVRVPATATGRP